MTQSSDIRVAVSTVILTLRRTDGGRAVLALPLVLRTREPFADQWARRLVSPAGCRPSGRQAGPIARESCRRLVTVALPLVTMALSW